MTGDPGSDSLRRAGVSGHFALLEAPLAKRLVKTATMREKQTPGFLERPKDASYWAELGRRYVWYRSLHLHVPLVRDLGRHPRILAEVKGAVGQSPSFWGSQRVQKGGGQDHRWHADVECLENGGVTVWPPLRDAGAASRVRFVEGSHLFATYPQELLARQRLDLWSDQRVLEAARALQPAARVLVPRVEVGSFVISQGRTWHASFSQTKASLMFHYAPAGARTRIPITFAPPLRWHRLSPDVVRL